MPRRIKPKKERRKVSTKTKPCRFCSDEALILDYKNPRLLGEYLSERGKLVSRRVTGNCRFHQTRLVESVSRARQLALLPYTITHSVRD